MKLSTSSEAPTLKKEQYTLTTDQQAVYNVVEGSNNNLLICGKPGVGKSVLIDTLTTNGTKSYTLAAPTGLAALNIGGRTLHSLFRLPVSQGIIHPEFNNFPDDDKITAFVKYRVKHLIIDECSMVRVDTFDYIDRMLRHLKGVDQPFGGVQVILVGDFFQLPPVVQALEKKQLEEAGYESEFLFHAQAFSNFTVLQLNEVLRQKGDNSFINLLHRARTGMVLQKDIDVLNTKVGKQKELSIRLCSTNREADSANSVELRKLPEPSYMFQAKKYGTWPAFPAPELLELKVGAQVMVKKNGADRPEGHKGDFNSQVVNGTIGKVIAIQQEAEGKESSVTIEIEGGKTATIFVRRWELKIKQKNDGVWEEQVVASYEQLPLVLAWAISIHKSQGQTFNNMHLDAARIFAPGQMYVALSRCKSLAGITINAPVSSRKFFANKHVLRFNSALQSL